MADQPTARPPGDVYPQPAQLTPQETRARRKRNVAIGLAVAAFVALFYTVTIAKLGGGVLGPSMSTVYSR